LVVSLCASVIYAAFAQGGTSGDLLICFSLYPAAFCSLGRGVGSALSFLFYSALALLCLPSVFSYLKAVCHAVTDIRGGNSVKIGLALTLISGFFGTFLLGDKGLSRLTFLDSEIACLLILFAGLFETPIFMKAVREKALLEEINRGGKTGLSAGFYRFSIGFLSPAVILLLIFAKIFF
jgi:SNF family Na+-dependent transporter